MRKDYSASCPGIDPPIDGASTPSSSGVVPRKEMIGHYYKPEARLLREALFNEYGVRLAAFEKNLGMNRV